ncbi:MAG: hypothetical protein HQK53_12380 [Oligoflexia bacterium]|nr:hypothetical protein [Oligoflexia bacterium]
MQFKTFEPNIEVLGQAMYSMIEGFGAFKGVAIKYLVAHGICEKKDNELLLDPAQWYSLDQWLQAFEKISRDLGDTSLFLTGKCIPINAKFPTWVKDVESAVKSIDIAFHMNHRKNGIDMFNPATGTMLEGIGHYGFEKIADKKVIISVCNTPYPCEFDRGIITAMANKFELRATVVHDNTKPCRKNGQDSCTYIINY